MDTLSVSFVCYVFCKVEREMIYKKELVLQMNKLFFLTILLLVFNSYAHNNFRFITGWVVIETNFTSLLKLTSSQLMTIN